MAFVVIFSLALVAVITPGSASASTVSSSITVNFGGAETAPPNFWGLDYASSHNPGLDSSSAIAQTPTKVLVWPAANDTETTNITSGVIYVQGGTFQAPVTIQDFIATCQAIACKAIIGLPMEINSPATDAYEARYVVDTLHFTPAFFVYGNEPAHWTCFGVSWAQLAAGHSCNTGNTTITAFATETEAAIRAVTAALGSSTPASMCLGGSGNPGAAAEEAWIHGLLSNSYDKSACAAYAMHSHPAYSNKGKPTLASFYATLTGPKGLADSYQNASRYTDGAPLYMAEVGTFTPKSVFVKPFMGSWAMDVFDSALMVQAMQNRVPDMAWWAWSTGGADGMYNNGDTTLYHIMTTMFSRLGNTWMPSQYVGQDGIFSEATMNATGWSVMLVSTNVDQSFKIQVASTAFNLAACGHAVSWTSSGSTSQSLCPAGNAVSVAPQSVVLLTGARRTVGSTAVPITFSEAGLPSGTPWAVTLNGTTNTSESSSITLMQPNGSYAYSVSEVSGYQASPSQGTVTLVGTPVSEAIAFSKLLPPRYNVIFQESGLPSGAAWAVTINGSTSTTTNMSLEVQLSSGSYAYSVSGPKGYNVAPSSGELVVVSSPIDESLSFANVSPPSSTVTLSGSTTAVALSPLETATIVAASVGVIVAAVVVGLVLVRRSRTNVPPPPPPD